MQQHGDIFPENEEMWRPVVIQRLGGKLSMSFDQDLADQVCSLLQLQRRLEIGG